MSYPLQYFRIGIGDTDNNIAISGSSLVPSHHTGKNHEKWYLNFISSGVFQIANTSNNQVITANGNAVSISNNSNSAAQSWKIEGVQKDYDGYYLYYKITSNSDSSKALTYTANKGFSLTSYSGVNYQKFKLNLDGLEGFAANCKTNSGEKAGTIGGLLGSVVMVTTADELEKQLNSVGAQIIVINANIDMKSKSNTRIRDYKTIVGSFKYHTIYDSQFRTNDAYGAANDSPSDNIIFRNLDLQARNVPNRILINIWSSRQIWIDHINFNSSLNYSRTGNGQDEVGKFIWLNTPYENYKDAKDRLRSPDYMTISYCKFTNRYWTVAYGTQNSEITRDRTTLLYNFWNQNVRRCPQLGNGICHVYNNYYQAYGQKNNGSATTGIIGGDGSEMLSQNNMFNGYTKGQALVMGGSTTDPCRDDNSYFSADLNATPSKINFAPKKKSSWNPNNSNYGYSLLDGYNTSNNDTKAFCTKYAGCYNSQNGIKYITDSDFSSWVKTAYASPFLKHIDFSDSSSSGTTATFNNGACFKIKNVNSGLYMQVQDAKAENGANVQQWGTTDGTIHDIWKTIEAGNGYYYLVSCLGDGGTFCLDVTSKSTANGTNIEIYQYKELNNQQYLITQNSDGSYTIKTRVTGNNSAIEIKDAGNKSGDNVQQWELNGHPCQNWIFEPVANPGCVMNTENPFEFENANSKLVMDIVNGTMEENTNVQQWPVNHYKCQQWILKAFKGGGNLYYIHSASDENFVLKPTTSSNGGNICIVPYTNNDSAMLFKFSKNLDGSYLIITHASRDACYVEVANASLANGGNVQQWVPTNHACQNWKLNIATNEEEVTLLSRAIKTNIYKDGEFVHTVIFVK